MKLEVESNGKTSEFKKIMKCIEFAEKNREISEIESESLTLFLEDLNHTIKTLQYTTN